MASRNYRITPTVDNRALIRCGKTVERYIFACSCIRVTAGEEDGRCRRFISGSYAQQVYLAHRLCVYQCRDEQRCVLRF